MSLVSSFFEDHLEVGQGGESVVRVLVVFTDPFQDRAIRMFGHSTRNTSGLVTPNCRFLNHDTYCDVFTRYGPFSKVARNMTITVKITRLSHREINKCSVNSG